MKTISAFSTKFPTKVATALLPRALAIVLVGVAFSGRAQSDLFLAALTKATSEKSNLDATDDDKQAGVQNTDLSDSPASDAWLGVSTSEASEALSSQLNLQPGIGLLVNFVATNSPAEKAGLQRN